MTAFKGWKTLGFGLLVTILPPILAFLGTIDWANSKLPTWAISLIGIVIMLLRYLTTTPIFKTGVVLFAVLFAGLSLLACSSGTVSTVASGVTPTTVCQAIATLQAQPAVVSQLASIPPTSALGVVWADFQSGCVGGQPTAGVSASWTSVVAGMFKTLLPQVLPTLAQYALPLVVGLL